jgi:hypothetical protein
MSYQKELSLATINMYKSSPDFIQELYAFLMKTVDTIVYNGKQEFIVKTRTGEVRVIKLSALWRSFIIEETRDEASPMVLTDDLIIKVLHTARCVDMTKTGISAGISELMFAEVA